MWYSQNEVVACWMICLSSRLLLLRHEADVKGIRMHLLLFGEITQYPPFHSVAEDYNITLLLNNVSVLCIFFSVKTTIKQLLPAARESLYGDYCYIYALYRCLHTGATYN